MGGAKGSDILPNVSTTVPPPKAKKLSKADGIFGNFGQDDDSVTLTSGDRSSATGAKGTDILPNVSTTVPPPSKKLSKADGIFGNFDQDDDSTTLTDDRAASTSGAKSTDSLPNVSSTVPPPAAKRLSGWDTHPMGQSGPPSDDSTSSIVAGQQGPVK